MEQQPSNVIELKSPRTALFSPELRSRLEKGIPQTDKPVEIVNSVEQILCTHLVSIVSRGAAKFAKYLGEKIGTL